MNDFQEKKNFYNILKHRLCIIITLHGKIWTQPNLRSVGLTMIECMIETMNL